MGDSKDVIWSPLFTRHAVSQWPPLTEGRQYFLLRKSEPHNRGGRRPPYDALIIEISELLGTGCALALLSWFSWVWSHSTWYPAEYLQIDC